MRSDTTSFRIGDRSLVGPDAGESRVAAAALLEPDAPAVKRVKPLLRGRRILIVQGDWEAGMSLLALDLKDAGHHVGKVVFCVPDLVYRFRGVQTHVFRDPLEDFDEWLRDLVKREGYDTFFLYNHFRPYNQIAWNLAAELDLGCQVFELGLIRPNCVMVFNRNSIPIKAVSKAWQDLQAGGSPPEPEKTPGELCQASTSAKLLAFCTNFIISRITSPLFPNFVDQRDMNLWSHLKHSAIHLWRFIERSRDDEYDALFSGDLSGKYYAVPLQVHSDTQLTKCSPFVSVEQFIKEVVASFEHHAPAETKLVFKVHPMDRGYKDYANLIAGLDDRMGGGRLLYVDRVHLPTLLQNARGLVNINSSVGLSGLVHLLPVITLGTAVYDLPELTFRGGLDEFWTMATKPSRQNVQHFVNLLLSTNQGRGVLSQRCIDVPGRCRIQWPPPFQQEFFEHRGEADSLE